MSQTVVHNQTANRSVTPGQVPQPAVRATAYWMFDAVPYCGMKPSRPDQPEQGQDCTGAVSLCQKVKGHHGNATAIWGRVFSLEDKPLTAWQYIGWTCYPDAVADSSRKGTKGPSLQELIRREFTQMTFTVPSIGVQPPDGRSFVNKDIFVKVGFDGAGNGPGETHAATLLGHRVVFTPVLQSIVYDWGDKEKTGPTKDQGGEYPDGTIRHQWPKHGSYTVTVTATYTATYTIDGGAPRAVNLTKERASAKPITVVESENVLVP